MSFNKSSLFIVIVPVVVVVITMVITATVILHQYRRRKRALLPITERPPTPLFTERHIASLRNWQKTEKVTAPPMDSAWPKLKTDPTHIPFLAAPCPSHQPERPIQKGQWQKFKEKEARRKEAAKQMQVPTEKWHHQPKGPAYWRQVGAQMRAERSWWEKLKGKVGM